MPKEQKVTRKLRAILSADVKGYSILMADDEVATIQTLKNYRNSMSECIEQRGGRVVDAVGDNLLAEFGSVVDAVRCAVEVQKELKVKNQELLTDKRLEFRIGVNIGDVIQDENRIYGDGVNVAARIEGLAEPGGVSISRNAYNHIKDKLNLGYEYAGEHEVKNIKNPIKVYKVLMDSEDAGKLISVKKKTSKLKRALIAVAIVFVICGGALGGIYLKFIYLPAPPDIDPENKMTFDLPKGPSIAVLPFDNMTGDPKQDYICDGITENIISTLSYSKELFIIARNSTFAYKGKQLNVKQIGKELNANWIIEGSIQKSKERIRITVQLIDASSGHHRWSETYDREFEDIFELQDEIALAILKEMQIQFVVGERTNFFYGANTSKEYKEILKIYSYLRNFSPDNMKLVQRESLKLIEMNPSIVITYIALSYSYLFDIWHDQCESTLVCFGKATEAAKKALSLNENSDGAYILQSRLFLIKGEHEKAINAVKKAIALNPNSSVAYNNFGYILIYADQLEDAIDNTKKAIRLNPLPPADFYFDLGFAYQQKKRFEEAIKAYNKSLEINPESWGTLIGLVVVYGHMGDADNAKSTISELFRAYPEFSKNHFLKTMPFKYEKSRKFVADGILKAGLKD